MLVASTFAFLASLFVVYTGDIHAHDVAQTQPMKLAAMEGLYKGTEGQSIVAFGILNGDKKPGDGQEDFHAAIKIPKLLSLLATHDMNGFVPGIEDLYFGNEKYGIESLSAKIEKGKKAIDALKQYKAAKDAGDEQAKEAALDEFRKYEKYMGYGYFDKPDEVIPPVKYVFYSFHLMVIFGSLLVLITFALMYLSIKKKLDGKTFWLRAAMWSALLAWLSTELGWVTAEVGRQPWAITELLPVKIATSHLSVSNVQLTFFMFLAIFTLLLIAEVKIMLTQIKKGI